MKKFRIFKETEGIKVIGIIVIIAILSYVLVHFDVVAVMKYIEKYPKKTTGNVKTTSDVKFTDYVIPNGTYYRDTMQFTKGQYFPIAKAGDKYDGSYYSYIYISKSQGWKLSLNENCSKYMEEYGEILPEIAGVPIKDVSGLFLDCEYMVKAPSIPISVINMDSTFKNCKSLVIAPLIPPNVKSMRYSFENCVALTEMPDIPYGVQDMDWTFSKCRYLMITKDIPDSVTSMEKTFYACVNLNQIGKLSKNAIDLTSCFEQCFSLTEMPEIPDSVTIMYKTFYYCKMLKTTKPIPKNVVNMEEVFNNCRSIEGTIVINANPNQYTQWIMGLRNIKLEGESPKLEKLAAYLN